MTLFSSLKIARNFVGRTDEVAFSMGKKQKQKQNKERSPFVITPDSNTTLPEAVDFLKKQQLSRYWPRVHSFKSDRCEIPFPLLP